MSTSLADAIALNRDSGISAPDIRLPLVPPIDELHCSAWERQLRKLATPWESRRATPDLWHQIPAAAGLYMFVWRIPVGFDMAGKEPHYFRYLLYCGQAGADPSRNTLRGRYKAEYSKYLKGDPAGLFEKTAPKGRTEWLSRWLLLHPLEYWWTEVNDQTKLNDLERELIRILAPPLNTQHNKLRAAIRRVAF